MPPDIALTIGVGIVSLLVGIFGTLFLSPKEYHSALEKRVDIVESGYHQLALKFTESNARHDEALQALKRSVDRLTDEFGNLEDLVRQNHGRRGNG
ncbi:MAG TPA: hypothetical protein VJV74_05395 [Terriglobia bacterium]|nr:hypothetical protein [Terriglobia bacterium]